MKKYCICKFILFYYACITLKKFTKQSDHSGKIDNRLLFRIVEDLLIILCNGQFQRYLIGLQLIHYNDRRLLLTSNLLK